MSLVTDVMVFAGRIPAETKAALEAGAPGISGCSDEHALTEWLRALKWYDPPTLVTLHEWNDAPTVERLDVPENEIDWEAEWSAERD